MLGVHELVHVWRQLRAPFPLPCVTAKSHVCEWEKLEIDVLGCTLCGKVHACEYGSCQSVLETSDGLVCELSGVVVYGKRYVESEFMDTVCVTGTDIPDWRENMGGDVAQIVRSLLCSPRQARVQRSMLLAMLEKCTGHFDKQMRQSKNTMAVCMQALSQFSTTPYVFAHVSQDERQRLVRHIVEQCIRILHILANHGMHIRINEVQRLAVGIVYLMRCGVTMNGVFVLQRVPELESLLPPESSLLSAFSIHPKYITEMENRLKFCLRNQALTCE